MLQFGRCARGNPAVPLGNLRSKLAAAAVRSSSNLGSFTEAEAKKPLAAKVSKYLGQAQKLETKLAHPGLEKEDLAGVLLSLVRSGAIAPEVVHAHIPEPRFFDRPLSVAHDNGLRFAIGKVVDCRMSSDEWARGTIVGHYYREDDWPEGQKAPYQILLEGDDMTARTIWAPSDTEECVRAALRFDVGAAVDCCVGNDRWVRGTVVAHYYREPEWPMQLLAPYRVLLDGHVEGHEGQAVYIWAPIDSDECIRRAASHEGKGEPLESSADRRELAE